MSAGDMVRNSNSWHWLAAVVLLSAAGSVFAPGYGWKDALAYRSGSLEPQARKQAERLAALEALREGEAVQAQKQAAEAKKMVEKCKADFAACGFEAVPQGEESVFAAQSRVSGALAKRRIRIVSSEASVKGPTAAESAMGGPRSVAAAGAQKHVHPKNTVTAAEFKKRTEQAAAKIKDKKLRETFLSDVRRKLAQMEAAEKNASRETTEAAFPRNAANRVSGVPSASPGRPSFKAAEINYKASGDFRDIFMFFVGETHVRANYAFKDIAVTARDGEGMDLSFTLLVNHR